MVLSGSHLRNRNEITVLFRKGQKKPQGRREKATYNVLLVDGGEDERNESDYPRYRPMAVRDSPFSQPSAPFFPPLRSLEPLRSREEESGSLRQVAYVGMCSIQRDYVHVLQVRHHSHCTSTEAQHRFPPVTVTVSLHPSNGDASERFLCRRRKTSGVKNGPVRVIDRVRCAHHQYLAMKRHFQ